MQRLILMLGVLTLGPLACGGVTDTGIGGAGGTGGGSAGDTCRLPAESGSCRGDFPRYFFNSVSGKCERFSYGGCGGNANNFTTLDQCVQACAPASANDACQATSCPDAEVCAYFSDSAACAETCDQATGSCGAGSQCTCGSSCRGCDDCIYLCKQVLGP